MKKFIKYVIIFAFPIFCIGAAAEFLLRKIPNDYSFKKNYLDAHAQELEVLFLGSSHAFYAVDPQFIHANAFNAAYISQTLDYDGRIIDHYKNKLQKLKCIAISISYFSFNTRLEKGEEAWRIKNYLIYYKIPPAQKFTNYSEVLSNKSKVNVDRIYSYYFLHKNNITCSTLGWGTNYHSGENPDLIKLGAAAAKRHTKMDSVSYTANYNSLGGIIRYAHEHNIKVLLYTTPASRPYINHLEKKQLEQMYTTVQKIVQANDNVIYTDFLASSIFKENDFYDADHLNESGAMKFSKMMDSVITHIDKTAVK